MYSVFRAVYALIRQLSDSTFSIFFQKIARGADAPFEFFEESLLVSAHFRGLDTVDAGLDAESRGDAVGIPCVVIVRVAVRVHIAEVVRVARIHGAEPPVAGVAVRTCPTGIYGVFAFRSLMYPFHRRLSLSITPRRRDSALFANVVQVWNVRSYSSLLRKKLLPSSTSS